MADHPPDQKIPEPAQDIAALERRKAREQQRKAEEAGHSQEYDDDDDDLDLDPSYADPHRMTLSMRLLYFMLLLFIAGMVGYLILIILYPDQFATRDWIGATATKEKTGKELEEEAQARLKGFQMGGIYLGISPEYARRIYPSMRLEPAPYRRQTGYFLHHDGQYQVSFRSPDRGGRAYRVKSQHIYAKVSYLELLTELSGKYGKPVKSGCGAEGETIAIQCTLRWKMKGVLLEALIRTAAPEGGEDAKTLLAVTATDTRPDSAFIGLEDNKQGKRKKKVRQKLPPLMPK